MRNASQEENLSLSAWLDGISNVRKQMDDKGILKGYIDLFKEEDTPDLGERGEGDQPTDAWSQNPRYWIRLHNQPRERFFRPDGEEERPFDLDEITSRRIIHINQEDVTSHMVADEVHHKALGHDMKHKLRSVQSDRGSRPQ